MLENLPDKIREAWLNGNWDVFAGQYFPEFNREIHVTDQYDIIDPSWRRYVTMDYGLDMLACYWIALDPYEKAYVYRGIYEPNLIISAALEKIKERTPSDEKIYDYFAPPDLWNRRQDTGKSVADIFADGGIHLTRVSNNRTQGWLALKEYFRVYKDEQEQDTSNIVILDSCTNLIRSIPQLQHDTKKIGDVATQPHEITHAPDALRYFVSGRPTPERIKQIMSKPAFAALQKHKPNPLGAGSKITVI